MSDEADECEWCGHTRADHRGYDGEMGHCNVRRELTWCECMGFVEPKPKMTPDDEAAIARAAETRHQAQRLARCEAQEREALDAARAELPRALREDSRERWRWWKNLAMRVLRRL